MLGKVSDCEHSIIAHSFYMVCTTQQSCGIYPSFIVTLRTYILFAEIIYIFFVHLYIESLRSHARPGRGKPALMCTLIGSGPTNCGMSAHSETLYMLELKGIYALLNQYISAIEDTEIAYDCMYLRPTVKLSEKVIPKLLVPPIFRSKCETCMRAQPVRQYIHYISRHEIEHQIQPR